MADRSILVVDDNEINLKVFVSLLRETKMQIDTAESADAAIALFKRNFYDVIFLDHMMPDKDGIETLKEMKECNDKMLELRKKISENEIEKDKELMEKIRIDNKKVEEEEKIKKKIYIEKLLANKSELEKEENTSYLSYRKCGFWNA